MEAADLHLPASRFRIDSVRKGSILLLTWGQFRKLLPEKLADHDFRLRLKASIRAVVENVVVDLPTKTFEVKLKDYAEPITAELEGENLYYKVTTGKDISLGCCAPLKSRWNAGR